jgi:hypothetical protein
VAERDLAEGLAKLAALRERTVAQVVVLRPCAQA